MNDSFIYPCVIHLMHITDNKQKSNPNLKQYYHTYLIIQHYIQSIQIFKQKQQLYHNLLKYYRKNWLSQTKQTSETQNSNSLQQNQNEPKYLKQIQKLSKIQNNLNQIIVNLLIINLQLLINNQPSKREFKKLAQLCKQLQLQLIFEGISVSQLILKFLPKIVQANQYLSFYQYLLNLFNSLDYYQVISFVQVKIQKYKDKWNQKQKENQEIIGLKLSKKNKRQTIYLPTSTKNISVDLKMEKKQNQLEIINKNSQQINNTKSLESIQLSKTSIHKSNFKSTKNPIKNQPSRRKSFFQDKKYPFTSKKSQINSSQQTIQQKQSNFKTYNPTSYIRSREPLMKYEQVQINVLAGSTPQKKRKTNKKK